MYRSFEGNQLREQHFGPAWQRLSESWQIFSLQPTTNSEQRLPHEHSHGDLPCARFVLSSYPSLSPKYASK
jgi:hypothetical protein